MGQFVYAVLVTLTVIFAAIAVGRAAERAKRLEEERNRDIRSLAGVPTTSGPRPT